MGGAPFYDLHASLVNKSLKTTNHKREITRKWPWGWQDGPVDKGLIIWPWGPEDRIPRTHLKARHMEQGFATLVFLQDGGRWREETPMKPASHLAFHIHWRDNTKPLSQTEWELSPDLHMCVVAHAHLHLHTDMHRRTCVCVHTHVSPQESSCGYASIIWAAFQRRAWAP